MIRPWPVACDLNSGRPDHGFRSFTVTGQWSPCLVLSGFPLKSRKDKGILIMPSFLHSMDRIHLVDAAFVAPCWEWTEDLRVAVVPPIPLSSQDSFLAKCHQSYRPGKFRSSTSLVHGNEMTRNSVGKLKPTASSGPVPV